MFDRFTQDIRFALRTLWKTPGFAAVAILTIGLGIGANTAIFSVVRAVLIRPLPYENPEQLAFVWAELTVRGVKNWPMAPPTLQDFRDQSTSFDAFAGILTFQTSLTGEDAEPQLVQQGAITPNLFSVLGVTPFLGRDFTADDAAPVGADAQPTDIPPPAIMLSHELWRDRFGGDRDIIGRSVNVGANPAQVIGVMPEGFKVFVSPESGLSSDVDIWVTPRINFATWPSRANVFFSVIGRMAENTTLATAQAEMDGIAARIRELDSLHQTIGYELEVVPMQSDVTETVRPMLMALLGAVGFVLLIACANVSNLLLVRAQAREGEVAIRAALGGSRWRLVRQMLTESTVLALAGAVVGILLAQAGTPLLLALQPADFPRLDTVGIDWMVLAFTMVAAFASVIAFGMIPAAQASNLQLSDTLRDRGRSSALSRQRLFRTGVIVSEVALSVILLIGAGLMVRSFAQLQRVTPGFNPDGVLTFGLQLQGYDVEQRANFNRELKDRLLAMPGVVAVSAATPIPLSGISNTGRYGTEEALADETKYGQAEYRFVTPDYLETMETRLMAGPGFSASDFADGNEVVMIDTRLARILWPDESPIGKRMLIRVQSIDPQWVEVVGVVEHQRAFDLAADGRETVYFTSRYVGVAGGLTWLVRTSVDPMSLAAQARSEVKLIDPNLPIANLQPMSDYVGQAQAPTRFALVLIGVFAIVALALASIGLYSVLASIVRQRTAEIGVRIAFGAENKSIMWLVVGRGMIPILTGVAVGLLGAVWLTQFMASLLVGVTPTDPATFAAISALFIVVALIASYVPARRATRIDPIIALKGD